MSSNLGFFLGQRNQVEQMKDEEKERRTEEEKLYGCGC